MSFQIGRVVGPALGSLIVASSGATAGLFVNGVSFILPALLILPVVRREPRVRHDQTPVEAAMEEPAKRGARPAWLSHWLRDVKAGWITVARHPMLSASLLVSPLVAALLVGPFLVAMPFLVAEEFAEDPRVLGLLLSIFPIGFILGGIWAGRQARLHHRGRFLFGGMAVAGVMLAVFGLHAPLMVLAAAALANGFALEVANLAQMSSMQELVPEAQMGRVASLNQLTGWVATPVAFAIAGWATETSGPSLTFLIGAGLAAGIALLPLLHPRVLRFD
jgi:predicted MFS family arabinose efflux permease